MSLRPICEPVELPLGASVVVDRVRHPRTSPAGGGLLHFHDVGELVLFDRVDGWLLAGGRRYRLGDGSVVFVPSMHRHDFAIAAGEKRWRLVQIDPYLVERIVHRPDGAHLARPLCGTADATAFARLVALADWLGELTAADPHDPAAVMIAELLLLACGRVPSAGGVQAVDDDASIERLLPAIERLRQDPSAAIPLDQASTLCNLSPAYFSRRFKQVLGMNFTDYARAYRLHVAARRIATSRQPMARIAFDLGFSSPSHFSQRFHERFGMTPRDYRRGSRRAGHAR